jgi:Tfp pilus assembly protein PilE
MVRIAFGAALDWNAEMSENEPEKAKKGWGCVQWSVVVVMLFMGGIVLPAYEFIAKKSNQMRAGESFRQIFHLMMTYASDHEGYFPDHDKDLSTLTANAAFRSFMQEGLLLVKRFLAARPPGSYRIKTSVKLQIMPRLWSQVKIIG